MGAEIRLINENTDMSKVEIHYLDWDCVMHGQEFQILRIPGYVHTIGGRYGENDYWAVPRGVEPTNRNLYEFDGEAPTWGITMEETNYYSNKWNEAEIRKGLTCNVLRNGEVFYTISASRMDYAYAKAYSMLTELKEGVINYHNYHFWEKEIVGRHIWYKREPYTLIRYIPGQCCAMAVADHLTPDVVEEEIRDGYIGYKLDLLADKNITWFGPDY